MRLRYFAWVRERVGRAEEEIDLPDEVGSVAELMSWLAARDEGYAAAFAEPTIIRTALDHDHVDHGTRLGQAREVAFFPPMTGG
jgi:molybdopterin synthase sulfur carrier subunit